MKIFPKTAMDLKFEHGNGNASNESLDQEKSVENLGKCGSKSRTSEPRPIFTSYYKKKNVSVFSINKSGCSYKNPIQFSIRFYLILCVPSVTLTQ